METNEHLQTCPICKSRPQHWAVKKYPHGTYTIDRCPECGYAFANPRPSMNFLKAHYSNSGHGETHNPPTLEAVLVSEAKDPNSTLDAARMIATIRHLIEGRDGMTWRLLDVGSGYGFFSKEALANGFQVAAIDLAENERKIAHSISGVIPLPTSFEDLDLAPSSLSVVLMSQILEHALDVEAWVSKAWQLLEDGGILAIALPNFGSLQRIVLQEKEPYICPPDHLNFFTTGALTALLEENGFSVEKIQHVSRVPKCTIQKRMPGFIASLGPPLWLFVNAAFRLVDFMRLGTIVNVYARKVSG